MLIRLEGTEGIEQLADQHCKAGGHGDEQMHRANVAAVAPRCAQALLNDEGNVGRLATRSDKVRTASVLSNMHERAKGRKALLSGSKDEFAIIRHRYENSNISGTGILT
jgi:hypothetical protein